MSNFSYVQAFAIHTKIPSSLCTPVNQTAVTRYSVSRCVRVVYYEKLKVIPNLILYNKKENRNIAGK